MSDPRAFIGKLVTVRRQPAPNSFGREFPEQFITDVLIRATPSRGATGEDWSLVFQVAGYFAYGPDSGYFLSWSIVEALAGTEPTMSGSLTAASEDGGEEVGDVYSVELARSGARERRAWSAMRRQDFDASEPLSLFDRPAAPVTSTGDDLLSLL